MEQIEIRSFINIEHARWVRWFRRLGYEYNEEIWDVYGSEDIFGLRRLFGIEHEFDIEEEEV